MHSLFLRIFMLFWVAMALIVGGSIAITFTIAAHEYEAPELQRRPGAAIQASEALAQGGIGALKSWLDKNKNAIPDRDLYIVRADGADILGRRLPENAARRLEFFNRDEFVNRRFPRAAPQIVGPDGSAYTVLLVPRRPSIFGALSLPEISTAILCIALVVSALTSWWLARHLSAPIRRIQAGARALASENLELRGNAGLRVSAGLEGRQRRSSRFWRAISTPWPISCGPIAAPSPSCCATSLTNCARRSPACGWRSASRASRPPTCRASWIAWSGRSSASIR